MKRFTFYLFVLVLLLSFVGCNNNDATTPTPKSTAATEATTSTETIPPYSVPSPMAYPSYTFTETPDVNDLRETAVRAMRDLLTIQWTPAENISYFNTAGRDKQFDYVAGTAYGGLLYSGAGSGLFQFLEYYNPETGLLLYPGTADELRKTIGSGCADSLLWSWGTVANSFSSGYYPSVMVQQNGYLPVGNYTYDPNLKSFYYLPTEEIIKKNGEAVMLDAYTKVLPADALVSSSADHAMMVIEEPTVRYKSDGTIDIENSYVYIQDQRGGRTSKEFYEVKDGSTTIYFNSGTRLKMTFETLLDKNYIPVTLAEFTGAKAYENAEVTTQGKTCTSLKDLQNVMIESNYPIAFISAKLVDGNGNVSELDKILFHGANGEGPAKTYNFSQWETLHTMDTEGYSKLRIEVVVSTGERFTVVEIYV